ncbi:hypothetical protein OWV82_017818 [Melia azedarach]|uniref:Uncharacterized protein n=1 Tax=Melia azedarach TaxID=155640 RepID=A0ACC1XBT7_MELAZ|nr:hypothetical protein OWV82_017818 [Melia azedarach]
MEGLELEEDLEGWVTGSLSVSELVKPVSFWTNSLKVVVSAWTKVVGAGEAGDEITVCWCLSMVKKKNQQERNYEILERNWSCKIALLGRGRERERDERFYKRKGLEKLK